LRSRPHETSRRNDPTGTGLGSASVSVPTELLTVDVTTVIGTPASQALGRGACRGESTFDTETTSVPAG
jgi:hypothetical protein